MLLCQFLTLWSIFGSYLITLLQFLKVCRHLFMHNSFKVPTPYPVEFRSLIELLQQFDFFSCWKPYCCRFAAVPDITVLLYDSTILWYTDSVTAMCSVPVAPSSCPHSTARQLVWGLCAYMLCLFHYSKTSPLWSISTPGKTGNCFVCYLYLI